MNEFYNSLSYHTQLKPESQNRFHCPGQPTLRGQQKYKRGLKSTQKKIEKSRKVECTQSQQVCQGNHPKMMAKSCKNGVNPFRKHKLLPLVIAARNTERDGGNLNFNFSEISKIYLPPLRNESCAKVSTFWYELKKKNFCSHFLFIFLQTFQKSFIRHEILRLIFHVLAQFFRSLV